MTSAQLKQLQITACKIRMGIINATDDAIAAIQEGRMAGTIALRPALIGSTAVDNAVKLIGGQGIAPAVPVEVTLITAANVG